MKSKVGTLMLAFSTSAALWCTGCATEVSEPVEAEDIASLEDATLADDSADATVAAADDATEATDEGVAALEENADEADADDEVTNEDSSALTTWDGHWRRHARRRFRRYVRRYDRWNDWDYGYRWYRPIYPGRYLDCYGPGDCDIDRFRYFGCGRNRC